MLLCFPSFLCLSLSPHQNVKQIGTEARRIKSTHFKHSKCTREGIWVREIRYSVPSPCSCRTCLAHFLRRIFVPASALPGKLCPQVCKGLTPSCHSDLSSNVTSSEVALTCISEVITDCHELVFPPAFHNTYWSLQWSGSFICFLVPCHPLLLSCKLQGTLSGQQSSAPHKVGTQ